MELGTESVLETEHEDYSKASRAKNFVTGMVHWLEWREILESQIVSSVVHSVPLDRRLAHSQWRQTRR